MTKTNFKNFSLQSVIDSEIVINSGKKLEIGIYLLTLGHVIRLRRRCCGSESFHHQAKPVRKTLIPTVLRLL